MLLAVVPSCVWLDWPAAMAPPPPDSETRAPDRDALARCMSAERSGPVLAAAPGRPDVLGRGGSPVGEPPVPPAVPRSARSNAPAALVGCADGDFEACRPAEFTAVAFASFGGHSLELLVGRNIRGDAGGGSAGDWPAVGGTARGCGPLAAAAASLLFSSRSRPSSACSSCENAPWEKTRCQFVSCVPRSDTK